MQEGLPSRIGNMSTNNWIFTVTQQKSDGELYSPDDILAHRMKDLFWGLGEKTPNRKSLSKGDRVVFYVGLPFKHFAASAVLSSDSFQLNNDQKKKFAHGKKLYTTDFGVSLSEIQMWTSPRTVDQIVQHLKFIENKQNWGAYFQGGVRQVSDEDFRIIAEGREQSLLEKITTTQDVVSQSEFALEVHLEEFIDDNWNHIDFGSSLIRYQVEDQNGRQFPAGQWSIDFFAQTRNPVILLSLSSNGGKAAIQGRANTSIHFLGF